MPETERRRFSVGTFSAGILVGAFLAVVLPAAVILVGDREETVSANDVAVLTHGLHVVGGAPRLPEDPDVLTLLVRHDVSPQAAVEAMRDNARAAGWRIINDVAMSAEGFCASMQTRQDFIAEDRPSGMIDAVVNVARKHGVQDFAVLVATSKC